MTKKHRGSRTRPLPLHMFSWTCVYCSATHAVYAPQCGSCHKPRRHATPREVDEWLTTKRRRITDRSDRKSDNANAAHQERAQLRLEVDPNQKRIIELARNGVGESATAEFAGIVYRGCASLGGSRPIVVSPDATTKVARSAPRHSFALPSDFSGACYLIVSQEDWTETYIGHCIDPALRMWQHNNVEDKNSVWGGRPWGLAALVVGFAGCRQSRLDFMRDWATLAHHRMILGDLADHALIYLQAAKDIVSGCAQHEIAVKFGLRNGAYENTKLTIKSSFDKLHIVVHPQRAASKPSAIIDNPAWRLVTITDREMLVSGTLYVTYGTWSSPPLPGTRIYVVTHPYPDDHVGVALVEVTRTVDRNNLPKGVRSVYVPVVRNPPTDPDKWGSCYFLQLVDGSAPNEVPDVFLEAAARACEACRRNARRMSAGGTVGGW